MVSDFTALEGWKNRQLLAYCREKRMLEKRILYFRAKGHQNDSSKLLHRLARLDDLERRLIPLEEKGILALKRLWKRRDHGCLW